MEREREKTLGDDDKHSLAGVPRAVCVTHKSLNRKKHNSAARPSQIHQPRHSPWLLPLISLGDVFCLLPSDPLDKNTRRDKKDRKHESKNKEVKRVKKNLP